MKLHIWIYTHYSIDDQDCYGDYHSIDIINRDNGVVLQSYGDDYHDKGADKVKGFIDALRVLNVLGEVRYEDVADSTL